jgi:hypothetical protein
MNEAFFHWKKYPTITFFNRYSGVNMIFFLSVQLTPIVRKKSFDTPRSLSSRGKILLEHTGSFKKSDLQGEMGVVVW